MARRNFRKRRKKTCYFTENNIEYIDFKDVDLLRRFINENGKILPKRVTGTKAGYQKKLSVAIKRARHMALIPFAKDE